MSSNPEKKSQSYPNLNAIENEEPGSFQCPYCDHPPYKYHKSLLTHLETKHSDTKT